MDELAGTQFTCFTSTKVQILTGDGLAGQQLMFANTYHLLLQPGPEIVAAAGKFLVILEGGGLH